MQGVICNPVQDVLPQTNEIHNLLQQLCTKVDNMQTYYEKREFDLMESIANLERKLDKLHEQKIYQDSHNTVTSMDSEDYGRKSEDINVPESIRE